METEGGSPGFCVIYRWRLQPGTEERFRDAWRRVTLRLREERGALGSRLHRTEEGEWLAYAQWPSRQAWERSAEIGPADAEARRVMKESILESRPPILLSPTDDELALVRAGGAR